MCTTSSYPGQLATGSDTADAAIFFGSLLFVAFSFLSFIVVIGTRSKALETIDKELFFNQCEALSLTPFSVFVLVLKNVDVWSKVVARSARASRNTEIVSLIVEIGWVQAGVLAVWFKSNDVASLKTYQIGHQRFRYTDLFVLAMGLMFLPWYVYRILYYSVSRFTADEAKSKLDQMHEAAEIDLSGRGMESLSWTQISRAIVVGSAAKWNFSGNIDSAGAVELAYALEYNHTVTNLDVSGQVQGQRHLDHRGVQALGRALARHTRITMLHLRACNIGTDGVLALQRLLVNDSNTTLTLVDLSHNGICNRGMVLLAKYLARNSTLRILNLSFNGIGQIGVEALCGVLQSGASVGQTNIDESDTMDDDDDDVDVEEGLKMRRLTRAPTVTLSLDLGVISKCHLRHLILSNNPIGDAGFTTLSQVHSPSLTWLELSGCEISDQSLTSLNRLVASNNSLAVLNLTDNRLTQVSVIPFLQALRQDTCALKSLHTLYLDRNQVDVSVNIVEDAAACLSAHPTLVQFSTITLRPCRVDASPDMRNRAGSPMHQVGEWMYCGRELGKLAIPGSDGRCGPTAGPQCVDCSFSQNALMLSDWQASITQHNGSVHRDRFHSALWLALNPTVATVNISQNVHPESQSSTSFTVLDPIVMSVITHLLLKNSSLTILDVSNNKIGDRGVVLLTDALCHSHVHLTRLNVAKNDIADEGAMALAKYVAANSNLHTMVMDWNSVGHKGAEEVAAVAKMSQTLKRLNFNCCDASLSPTFVEVPHPANEIWCYRCSDFFFSFFFFSFFSCCLFFIVVIASANVLEFSALIQVFCEMLKHNMTLQELSFHSPATLSPQLLFDVRSAVRISATLQLYGFTFGLLVIVTSSSSSVRIFESFITRDVGFCLQSHQENHDYADFPRLDYVLVTSCQALKGC